MIASSRRGFLAGALASAAAPSLARAQSPAPAGAPQAKQRVVLRGRAIAVSPHDSRLVVAHDRRHTIAIVTRGHAQLVDVGGQPLEIAISPGGRLAAVTTAFWDKPGLAIVDLRTATVRKRVDVGPAPFGVAFTPDGRRLVVTGGEQDGTAHVLDVHRLAVVARFDTGTCPRAVVAAPGRNDAVWIALNGLRRVVRMEIETGHIERTLHTPRLPDRIAVSPGGRRLLVSHGGTHADHVSEIEVASRELTRRRAGRLPSAVGWTRNDRRLVALGGAGQVVAISASGRQTLHDVGGAPRGLAVAGNRAWTVDALSGAIAEVKA